MTKTESHTVGEWLDKSQSKDLRILRSNDILCRFDEESLRMLYEDWCQSRGCLWASATSKNITEFIKHIKREK